MNKIAEGTVHTVPPDLKKALLSDKAVSQIWKDLTPLARNEWICWNITCKQEVTRKNHIKRTVAELKEGKRRPCCWAGCLHRTDRPLSPTKKWLLSNQTKAK